MATAKKLPSGSWRCLVYSHTERIPQPDGTVKQKRVYESFTDDDPSPKGKRRCEKMAADWAADKNVKSKSPYKTFGEALDAYIQARESVLSPATIRDYKGIRKNALPSLMNLSLRDITQEQIQEAINLEAQSHSPKTVRNIHGLLSAVFASYCPDFVLKTVLPKKIRPKLYIPSNSEIQRLMAYAKGSEMEISTSSTRTLSQKNSKELKGVWSI